MKDDVARPQSGAEPVRILHFLNSPGTPGGVEDHVFGLMANLPGDRFDLTLVCPEACYGFFAPLADARRHIVSLDLYALSQARAMHRLMHIIRACRFDIVHSHQFMATVFLAPIATVCRVPWVVETTHVREAWRRSWLKRSYLIDRLLYTMVDRFIAVSQANQHYLIKEKRCRPSKVVQIYPGRPMERFQPDGHSGERTRRDYGISPFDLLIVHVGRLAVQKGHRYLLEALPHVQQRLSGVKALFVGDGELRQSLRADVEAMGLGASVIFAGFQASVQPFLEAADLVVLPSLFEGLPHVPLEAGAMGKAVVASHVDGIPEIVVHGRTGLLVSPGDSRELAVAITALLQDPERRLAMGAAARSLVRDRFTVARQVQRHVELYEGLVSRHRVGLAPAVAGGSR